MRTFLSRWLSGLVIVALLATLFSAQAFAQAESWATSALYQYPTRLDKVQHVEATLDFDVTWQNRSIRSLKVYFPTSCALGLSLLDAQGEIVAIRNQDCVEVLQGYTLRPQETKKYHETWDLAPYDLAPGNYTLKVSNEGTLTNTATEATSSVDPLLMPLRLYNDQMSITLSTTKSRYAVGEPVTGVVRITNHKAGNFSFQSSSCPEENWTLTEAATGNIVYNNQCGTPDTTTVKPGLTYVQSWTYDPAQKGTLSSGRYELQYSDLVSTDFRVGSGGTVPSVTTGGSTSGATSASNERPFSDVVPTHWAFMYIVKLKALGVVHGDSDGRFRPEQAVTRAEFTKMLMEGLDFDVPSIASVQATGFTDVSMNDWFFPYVEAARNLGIVRGDPGTPFGPNQIITRGQAVEMAMQALRAQKGMALNADIMMPFSDVSETAWYAPAVKAAYRWGIIHGYRTGLFGPNNALTRAECAKVIVTARAV